MQHLWISRNCCKQKTYGLVKPFSCNTYKNTRGGAPQTRSATAVSMRLKKNNPPSTTSATAALDTRSSSPGACPRPVIAHLKPSITPAIGFSPYSHRQRGGMTVEG